MSNSNPQQGATIEDKLKAKLKGIDFHNPYPVHVHGSPQITYWTFEKNELLDFITTETTKAVLLGHAKQHAKDFEEIAEAEQFAADLLKYQPATVLDCSDFTYEQVKRITEWHHKTLSHALTEITKETVEELEEIAAMATVNYRQTGNEDMKTLGKYCRNRLATLQKEQHD